MAYAMLPPLLAVPTRHPQTDATHGSPPPSAGSPPHSEAALFAAAAVRVDGLFADAAQQVEEAFRDKRDPSSAGSALRQRLQAWLTQCKGHILAALSAVANFRVASARSGSAATKDDCQADTARSALASALRACANAMQSMRAHVEDILGFDRNARTGGPFTRVSNGVALLRVLGICASLVGITFAIAAMSMAVAPVAGVALGFFLYTLLSALVLVPRIRNGQLRLAAARNAVLLHDVTSG